MATVTLEVRTRPQSSWIVSGCADLAWLTLGGPAALLPFPLPPRAGQRFEDVLLFLLILVALVYGGRQWTKWREGLSLNWPKQILLAAAIPINYLHLEDPPRPHAPHLPPTGPAVALGRETALAEAPLLAQEGGGGWSGPGATAESSPPLNPLLT